MQVRVDFDNFCDNFDKENCDENDLCQTGFGNCLDFEIFGN